MKRFFKWVGLSTALISLAASVACSRKPQTNKEQASYALGAQYGRSLKAQNLDLDTSALARGLMDGYKGEEMKLTDEEMQTALIKLSDERQNEIRAEAEKNKAEAQKFLEQNKTAEGVKVTKSGLQYKITEPGTGISPKAEDTVVVHYKGTLIDGTEFDSSFKRNMPAEFPLQGVIPGWTEGLQLLKKGGKATLYIPPELGYGDRPRQSIPPNSVLVFDVELLDVKPSKKR